MHFKRLTVFSLLLLSMAAAACRHDSEMTAEKMETLIAKEVPSEANKSQVIAFLDAHRIDHSDVVAFSPEYLKQPEFDTDLSSDKLRGKVNRVKKQIVAKISNVKAGFLVEYDLFIKFYFDENDRLVEYLVRTIGTGL